MINLNSIFDVLQETLTEDGTHTVEYLDENENSMLIEIDGNQYLIQQR